MFGNLLHNKSSKIQGLSLRDRLLRQAAAGKVLGCSCDLQLRAGQLDIFKRVGNVISCIKH